MTRTMLSLKNLRKRYRSTQALNGIDLEVRDGEIFALLGPTGAGKSSSLLAAAGLIELDGGTVTLDGEDVTDADPACRDLSIVFEGFNLLPVLSVYDNIAFALRSPMYLESEEVIRQRVHRTAELLRISRHLQGSVQTLSGGEKQRVALARALVRQPKMFLLDEPLSALDLKLREGLRAELREIHREQRTTMLYATHDYHGAVAIADRIGIIRDGRILQSGAIEEMFAAPESAFVGRLIGSPAMAFFDAEVRDGEMCLRGGGQSLALPAPVAGAGAGGVCQLGVWPEDIAIVSPGSPGATAGEIYALDNRGYETAVQVDSAAGAFRKVLESGQTMRQGETCAFVIAPGAGFVFDAATGARLSHRQETRA